MFSISAVVQPVKDSLTELWNGWRGPIILGVGLLLLGALVWHFSAPVAAHAGASATIRKIAITVVVLFAVFGLGLVVTFFWLFRGVDADAAQLDKIITYCYAFIVFSLSASVLPFVALPFLPALSEIMARSPIGIVPGCSLALDGDKQKAAPRELRCGANSEQWVVNIGGMAAPLQMAAEPAAPGAVVTEPVTVDPAVVKPTLPQGTQTTQARPETGGKRMLAHQPVALGLDVRGDEVAVRGWEQGSGRALLDVVAEFDAVRLSAYVVTQIQVDGTGAGPDIELYQRLLAATDRPVVASGGVGTLSHIEALAAVEVAGRRLDGVIVGRALYDGAFTLAQALAVAAG